jgi:hypothetical protein
MAKSIVVRRKGQSVTFEVDGHEFPWLISEDGPSLAVSPGAVPAVTVTILAESVDVMDELS